MEGTATGFNNSRETRRVRQLDSQCKAILTDVPAYLDFGKNRLNSSRSAISAASKLGTSTDQPSPVASAYFERAFAFIKDNVIDLREIEGGIYIPFLTGLAPLIDAAHLIGFVDRHGKKGHTVRYKNGIYCQQGRKKARLGNLSRYQRPGIANQPIAVLSGQYTASSGEMILLSLKGLPQVRTFGAATYGVPTGKTNFFLSDSRMIL